jgi:hypothetical protein
LRINSVTLAANTPTPGTGLWTIVSGAGGTIGTPTSPTSTFTGVAGTTYTLRWTISNPPCAASSDDVVITFNQNPTTANAGPDQTGASTCGSTSVTLAANTPTVGTGLWTIVSGAGGTIGTPASPTSTFSGIAGNLYTLRWTVTNPPCAASFDEIDIRFNTLPVITVNLPSDTGSCQNNSITLITVATGTPAPTVQWQVSTNGGASWSNISGATSPNYTFSTGPSDDGKLYRAVYTNLCGSVITNALTLSVGARSIWVMCHRQLYMVVMASGRHRLLHVPMEEMEQSSCHGNPVQIMFSGQIFQVQQRHQTLEIFAPLIRLLQHSLRMVGTSEQNLEMVDAQKVFHKQDSYMYY